MKLLGHYVLPLEITRELQVRVTRSAIKCMYWYFAYRRKEGCSFNISLIRRDVDGDKAEVHRGKVYFQSKQAGRGCVNTSDGISALKCTQHYYQALSAIKTKFWNIWKGWLAIAKLKPLSLSISLFLTLSSGFLSINDREMKSESVLALQ